MANELTDDDIHNVFLEFDRDGTNTLNMSELGEALRLLKIDLTVQELTETYRIDDDPETLNEEEFRLLIRERLGDVDCHARLIQCFMEFDEDNTGFISRDKLKEILLEKGDSPLEDAEVEELLNEFDTNADGQYDIKEFVDLMYATESDVQTEEY